MPKITKLGVIADSQSVLYHSTTLVGTPPVMLAGRCWEEMVHTGITDAHVIPFHDNDQVIWAEKDGSPEGFITFVTEHYAEAWVKCSYVIPMMRLMGVHTAMFDQLKIVARAAGCLRISGGTHVDNAAMLAAYEKQGRVKKFESWSFGL